MVYQKGVNLGGYHKTAIVRGTYGETTKIIEEVEELKDAENQGNRIMMLMEMSDIIGAIEGYLEKHHPSYTLDDLITMANATRGAFESGERK